MTKRIISIFLTMVTLLGLLTVPVGAAPSLEETMKEVNIFARNKDLDWLTMNGSIKTQHYTYYNYESKITGERKEIPAYCVNPTDYGVPTLVPEGTSIEYECDRIVSDPKVAGIVANGYPHTELYTLKLDNAEQAYYATKTALWCYLLSSWSVDKLGVNPRLTGAEKETAQKVLEATKWIYMRGMAWTSIPTPKLTASPDRDSAYPVTIDGKQYLQQVFTVTSYTWTIGKTADIALDGNAPAGTRLVDANNQDITKVTLESSGSNGYQGTVKVLYPADSIEGQDGTVQLKLSAQADQFAIFYAECAVTKYGKVQDYMLDTDPHIPLEGDAISTYSKEPGEPGDPGDPGTPGDPPGTGIKIIKLESGTNTPLEGAVFKVTNPDGGTVGSFSTKPDGTITIPVTLTGHYTVEEMNPPKWHLKPDVTTQHVQAVHGQIAEVTFYNEPFGNLRVEKYSDTGEPLTGVTIQIKHIATGETKSGQTGPGGAIEFTELKPGGWEVRETAGIEGWIATTDTIQTVSIVSGQTSTVTFTNKEKPGLRIKKFDRSSLQVLADIPFEVWRDGVSLGIFHTDQMGEILMTDLQPGTYVIAEVNSDDDHITDTTPQQIELKAGDGIKEVAFFNDKKPGIRLVKVDSANLSKVLPNVKFEIAAVDGSYGPKEFTTDQNGEIDLSQLPPGAYVVTELECPGYVIDDAQRIIELKPNETAEFVFTNSKKPDLLLLKTSSDGTPLQGVTFRLAKIEDGSRYLDRTTNEKGEILWEGLEPGVYSLKETATVADHILDLREYHVELFPGKVSTVCIENQKRPNLIIQKTDKDTGEPIPGVTFTLRGADGPTITTEPTDAEGKVYINNLLPGPYTVTEQNVPENYILDTTPQTVTLFPNRTATVQFQNYKRPTLKITKVDINGQFLTGAIFEVKTKAGVKIGDFPVGADGSITIANKHLTEGYYIITEKQAPTGYILDKTPHEVYLRPGKTTEVSIENEKKPGLTIHKIDSVVGEGIKGAKFEIYVSKDKTENGTYQKLDSTYYYTDANGIIHLDNLDTGWYKVVEVEPAPGFTIKEPAEQILYVEHDKLAEITFENTPLNGIVVEKYDSVTHAALPGCTFQLRYLAGTSGTGGTIIGQKVTGKNGTCIWTGLKPGTYVVEEVDPADGYSIINSSETVFIADGGEQSVITVRFTNSPDGSLLIRKVCSVNPSVTLANAEFKIMYSDGTLIGDSNGVYRTDEHGEIRIDGLKPGKSVIVTETQAPAGFILDTQSQTVQIKEGRTVSLTFKNQPKGAIIIQKRDSQTNQPLAGAEFRVTTAAGCEVGLDGVIGTSSLTQNGIFRTDSNGEIRITNLAPGAYVLTEIKAPDGYVMDSPSTNVVVGANGDTQTVVITNTPKATLTITKRDAVTRKPLANAEFIVRDSNGHAVGPTNGIYKTGTDGTVIVSGLEPGSTIMVSETKAPAGYILDETPKSIVVKSGISNSLIFDNEPGTTLIIRKFIEGTENEPLSGVCFKVVDGSGAAVGPDDGQYYTDKAGEIVLNGIEPGTTVIAKEIKTVEGFVLDGTPQDILIKAGEAQQLTFWNKRAGTLVIQKKDSVSGALIAGAQFQLTYASGGFVDNDNGHLSSNGLYTTDDKGEIRISGVTGTIVAKEIKAALGYVIDQSTQTQTVTVNPEDTQTLVFLNEPLCSLTIKKVDSVTGKPVPNTEFTVKDGNGTVLGRYTTGKDGTVTVTGLVPGSTVVVVETRVPEGYVLNSTPHTITVKNGTGNTVVSGPGSSSGGNAGGGNDITVENDPKMTLTIHKYIEGTKNEPLAGVAFKVTDGSGTPAGPSDGVFYTDAKGEIVIDGLEPGTTITAQEIKTVEGFVLDGTPKTIKIKAGEAPSLTFWNKQAGTLVIRKLDKQTNKPLAGVEFELTYANGGYVDNHNGHLSSNGLYKTDSNGEIRISGVTGTIVVKETKTIPGYTIDEATRTQTVTVTPQDTQTLTFYNAPKQTLTIQKYADGTTDPIQGVTFLVTDSSGQVIGPNNGEYITDRNGRIVITDLTPGTTITAKETKAASGYVLDSTPQSILIQDGAAQSLTFFNKSEGGLELIKVNEADKSQRIPNTTFEIRKMDGSLVDTITTDKQGRAHLDLDAGDYYAVEIEAGEGFKINSTPHYFTIRDNETTTLTITNAPFSGIIIHKVDAVTGEGIYGVKFLVYDENKNPIGEYSTDDQGYIYIDDLTVQGKGKLFIRELEAAEGYELDKQYKTIYVQPGKTVEIEWKNTPITGQIQIQKYAAEYNEVTGTPAGAPLKGAVYEITQARSGKVVDYITTDARGMAASKPLPLGRYKIVEVTAPAYWQVSGTVFDETLEYSGQIIKLSDYDKPSSLGVTITKRGNAEVLTGSQMRYDFTVANTSNVALENFYWHDRIPTDAARATLLTTGTYSARLNYRILYKTNYSGAYQVLASNLLTSSNYSFSLNAIPTQAGEYVTDVYFDFGKVPVGFQTASSPTLTVTISGAAANGYQLINRADVGGKYQGTWQTGQTTWVTMIRKLTSTSIPKLPKTGY